MTAWLAGLELPAGAHRVGLRGRRRELDQFFDITTIGAVVTKSIMLNPRSGPADPAHGRDAERACSTRSACRARHRLASSTATSGGCASAARTVVSIAGGSVDEYTSSPRGCACVSDIAAIEVNISCPNVEDRGQVFACHPQSAADVVHAVRRNTAPGSRCWPVVAGRHRHRGDRALGGERRRRRTCR